MMDGTQALEQTGVDQDLSSTTYCVIWARF